jgi:biopolymer transport protein ExbB
MTIWDQTLGQLLVRGGPVMWPLLGCSVLGLALILDRGLAHLRMRIDYQGFVEQMRVRVREGRLQEAAALCGANASPVAKAAGAYLAGLGLDDEVRASVVEREGSLALEAAERRLRGLAAVAHVSTLLGLLGTVAGLVGAFHTIELSGGVVQPSDLASGIWEALLTTVFGLSIAIPCLIAFHAFESRADAMARRMSFTVSYLDQWLGKHTGRVWVRGSGGEEPPVMRED